MKINPPPGCVTGKLGGIPLTCEFFVSPPPTSSYYYELSTHSNVNSGNASAGDGGNRFKLLMTFNDGYPYKSPDVRFSNRVFHINLMIGINGECRLLHFNHSWNPCWTIASLMEHISLLLIYPQIHLLPAKFRDIYEEWELIIRALVPATNESQSKRRQKSIDTVEKYSGNDDEESSFKDAISSADSFKTRGSYGPDKYCLIHSEDKDYAEEKSISPRFGSGVRNTVIGSKLEDDTVSNVKLDKIDIRGRDEEIIQRKQTDRKSDQDYKGNYGEIIPYAEDGNYYLDNNSEVTDDNYYDNQEHSEVTGNGVISPPSLVIRPSEDEVKAQQLLQDQLSSLNLSADIFFTKAIQRKIKKSFTRIEELHLQTLLLYLINRKRYFVLVSEFAKKFSEK